MSVRWNEFDKFSRVIDTYMPSTGEGDTQASQLVTAVNKLIYKWYNDGDVFDNTGALDGWANDLSSYANWLYKYIPSSRSILDEVYDCFNDGDYEDLLYSLANATLDDEDVENLADKNKVGSIYDCDGPFEWNEPEEDEDEPWEYEEEEDEWDEDIESSTNILSANSSDNEVLVETIRNMKDDFDFILSGIEKLDRSGSEDSKIAIEIADKLVANMQEIISDISERF